MAVLACDRSDEALSLDLEDPLFTGLEERVDVEVLDEERMAPVEEKLFPTFRILDLARTLDAFWFVKLFLRGLPLIPGCLADRDIFPNRFVWLRKRATLEIRGA